MRSSKDGLIRVLQHGYANVKEIGSWDTLVVFFSVCIFATWILLLPSVGSRACGNLAKRPKFFKHWGILVKSMCAAWFTTFTRYQFLLRLKLTKDSTRLI